MPLLTSDAPRGVFPTAGNLLRDQPSGPLPEERFDTLLALGGARVERIVSTGHRSPEGFWYEQPGAEWVMLVQGSASLAFEDEPRPRALSPGDWVFIEARRRHRVEGTSANPPTIWLALHLPA